MNSDQDNRIAKMTFATVYPLYCNKVLKKNRSIDELHQVINWLTGYSENDLQQHIKNNSTFQIFFNQAKLHPNAHLISGKICGISIPDIENTLTRQVRYLDKLVDELAQGRKMEKILRS